MISSIEESLDYLRKINPGHREIQTGGQRRPHRLQKVLVANRGEIAKRFFLSLKEEGIPSVAIVTEVDLGQSWYQQADEVVFIGNLRNYTNIPMVIGAAMLVNANAIYPGYGFLSENAEFVKTISETSRVYGRELFFMGPSAEVMDKVGEKLAARALAKEQGVPLFEGSESIVGLDAAKAAANQIGYPVIVKLSAGGGGKGMMPVFAESSLYLAVEFCQRTGRNLYNDDTFYLERYIQQPVHMEVQIFNGTAIGIRKCAVQRRNQKVIEETGDAFLDSHMVLSILAAAENMARISGYDQGGGAGTVEFLYDPSSQRFGFLEMNTRLQVEHPVTDQSLGIDLAKWQVLMFDGRENEIPYHIALEGRFSQKNHSIEARIYAEDPENEYAPAPGKIQELDLPTFIGLRCDFGFKKGDVILPHYDPMIGKIIVYGDSREEAITRLERALGELYIRGVLTNINQLLSIVRHPDFKSGDYTNLLLSKNKDLETPQPENSLTQKAAIFGALTEHARLVHETTLQTFLSRDLEDTIHSLRLAHIANSYSVKVYEHNYQIDLLQTSLDNYFVFLNEHYIGEVELLPRVEGNSDFLVRMGMQSYPIRVDHRPTFTVLRMPDEGGKIHYLKMNIMPIGGNEELDPPGMIRAPFQATFVAIARDEAQKRDRLSIGSYVKKDEPVIIISAMKMETTLKAPVSGKITYLIEDGDLSRLEIGKTADGLVIGKSISEGEALFIIEDEKGTETSQGKNLSDEKIELANTSGTFLNALHGENLPAIIASNPAGDLEILLRLMKAHFLGFVIGTVTIEKLSAVLADIPAEVWQKNDQEQIQELINSTIQYFLNIKQIYSPILSTNVSYFAELNRFVEQWENEAFKPSYDFKVTMTALFKAFDLQDWLPGPNADENRVKLSFVNILRSHNVAMGSAHIVKNLLTVLGHFQDPSRKTVNTLKRLVAVEQAERDDSVAEHGLKILASLHKPQITRDVIPLVARKYMRDYRRMVTNIYTSFSENDETSIEDKFRQALKSPEKDLLPASTPAWLKKELQAKLDILAQKNELQRFYSPLADVMLFKVKSREKDEAYYLAIGQVEQITFERDSHGQINGSENVDQACIRATQVLRAYHFMQKLSYNRVEIYATGKPVEADLCASGNKILNYNVLNRIGMSVLRFFTNVSIRQTIVHIDGQHPVSKNITRRQVLLNRHEGRLNISLLLEQDTRNPYFTGEPQAVNQRIFDRDKWPVELWAAESFDSSEFQEIRIKSIDETSWLNPKTGKEEIKPVGSRIFTGLAGGKEAVFYMKDSRISGGASGNLEGLKYVAAAYLAYLKDLPLYIWNDGAGANIKEGMVSLNRAGEGFLMNALLGGRVDSETFYRYTRFNPDEDLRKLFAELDQQLALDNNPRAAQRKNFFTVAVGVGSSTGLDVYGSSQNAIQLMLDTDESYRVLTGSNVIKSVTGEDLTNYQIGGAKVMGKWTGTVDLVAINKLHLLTYIRRIQEVFAQEKFLPAIARVEIEKQSTLSDYDVLNRELIESNVDQGRFISFKSEWYGSAAVLGGFARLGGHLAMIMGPYTNFGLRSYQAISKAKEILRSAHKTGAHQILIFGKKWYHETMIEDELGLRGRLDFMKDLQKKSGVRIHIITHIDGLHRVNINSQADAVILVKNTELSAQEYEKASRIATFICDDMAAAFDTARQVIDLLANPKTAAFKAGSQKPEIPADPAQPYDMVQKVILPAFDENSFLEFFGPLNNPTTGPSLVTGFARLEGQTVAIIADQPAIMGGAPDAPGTEKYRFFTELVARNDLPLIMLSNAPGFVPGAKQERLRIQQIGGESLDVNILSQMPVVSVVLNQNYGGRQIHAFSKYIRPGIVYLALKSAVMAVMGATASFDLFEGARYKELLAQGKDKEAAQLRQKYIADYNTKAAASNDAFQTGILDWLIDDINQLREHLVKGLATARQRVEEIFKSPL